MEEQVRSWTLAELAVALGAELEGDGSRRITRPVPAGYADPTGLTFAESEAYLRKAETHDVGAVLLAKDGPATTLNCLRVANPRIAFGRFLAMCDRPLPLAAGIHPTAVVDEGAQIADSARVGAYAVVERGARVGERAQIFAHAYIGENCQIGADSVVYPHAVLYQDIALGERVIIHAGAVLGADGFGYGWDGKRRFKIPQVGGVVIADDVEIGAMAAIDRATAGETKIGAGTKLDNLVQIAHNVQIGEHSAIASQVGIAGSSTVGDRVVMAGQAALGDHVAVGDDITLMGRTGVTKSLAEANVYWGTPARPAAEAMKAAVLVYRLPEVLSRLRELEKRLAELEK